MKKATFYTLIGHNGEKIAQEKTGYTFTDSGYTFNLYKIGSVWCVLESSTGLQVFRARTLKEAPAKVSEYINLLNNFFSHAGEQTKEAIKIIADATSKAQAVDGEAEKLEPTETEKKTTPASARKPKVFSKKRFYISLCNAKKETKNEEVQGYAFTCENRTLYTYKSKITKVWYIIEPSTGMSFGNFYTSDKLKDIPALAKNFFEEYGSRFDSMIEKFSDCAEAIRKANGKTTTKEETKTEKPAKAAEPIPTDTETPATSAGTVRTEKTAENVKPCTPCTMTAARRKWYNICANVYRSGTEPNHGASLVKPILSEFNIYTLTSMHRAEKRGYMNATQSHKAICTRTGTAPGRTQNRTRSRTNCEVTARGSPKNMASLQALILAS